MGDQYKDTGGLVEQANMFEQLQAIVDSVGRIDLNKDRFCVAEIASEVSQVLQASKCLTSEVMSCSISSTNAWLCTKLSALGARNYHRYCILRQAYHLTQVLRGFGILPYKPVLNPTFYNI